MAQTPSTRARRAQGMGMWIPGVSYGSPGSLYHDDGFCDAPYVPGTLACPECAPITLAPLAEVHAERIAWLEAGDEGTHIQKVDAHEAAAPTPRQPAHRANRFAGRCAACNQWVEAGAGWLTGRPGAWTVAHARWEDGGCPAAPEDRGYDRQPDPEPLRPGMYRNPAGVVVKVQLARQSGKPYAKTVEGEYLGGGRSLDGLVRLTLDEAKAYGRRTGVCCCCGAELTDPVSVAAGIGPICASKF